MLLVLCLASLVVSASHAFAALHQNASFSSNGHPLLRRWYGVQAITASTNTDEVNMPNIYPWPTTCTSPYTQPLRYCFRDARSANNLKDIVDGANAMWAQATKVTALKIELAAGCGGDPQVLCSDDRLVDERDALVISDETLDDDPTYNTGPQCQTTTTIGYRYSEKGEPYRHRLKFCSFGSDIVDGDKANAIRSMAHELGHAMGLQHEHQRPDRDESIEFRCRYLAGYADAQALVASDPQGLFDDADDTTFRMYSVCSDFTYAKHYFPAAIDFLRGDQFNDPTVNPNLDNSLWDTLQWSSSFDYDSIMIYDGDLGDPQARNVLSRKDNGQMVWMGGGVNGDPATTKISEGDVARIAMLYDAHTAECEAAKRGTTWEPVRVKIRDADWVVVPPPRKRDEL